MMVKRAADTLRLFIIIYRSLNDHLAATPLPPSAYRAAAYRAKFYSRHYRRFPAGFDWVFEKTVYFIFDFTYRTMPIDCTLFYLRI